MDEQRNCKDSGRGENSSNMSWQTEQTVPSTNNAINRHSCYQPSWLILKCHSGHSGIHPQYPRGNRVGIRVGHWLDRRPGGLFISWDVWEKKLDHGNYTLSLGCQRSLTIVVILARILTLPHAHLSLCVKSAVGPVWNFVWRWCFSGGVRSTCVEMRLYLFIDWTVVVSAVCENSLNKSPDSFLDFYFTQLQLQIFFGCTDCKGFWAKYLQKYSVIQAVMGRPSLSLRFLVISCRCLLREACLRYCIFT